MKSMSSQQSKKLSTMLPERPFPDMAENSADTTGGASTAPSATELRQSKAASGGVLKGKGAGSAQGDKKTPSKETALGNRQRDKLLINNGGTVLGSHSLPGQLINGGGSAFGGGAGQQQQSLYGANGSGAPPIGGSSDQQATFHHGPMGKYQSFQERANADPNKALIQVPPTAPSLMVQKKGAPITQGRQDSSQSSQQKMTPLTTNKQSSKLQLGGAIQINNRNGSVSAAMHAAHKSHSMGGHSTGQALKPIKRIENLPRTGIEYPFTKERRQIHFVKGHKEYEALSDQVLSPVILDEYIRNDQERANASLGQNPVVYDCIEPSPYYDEEENKLHPFIDEKDAIELPPITEQTEGLVNEPYQKRYVFNPLNLPYQLERAHCMLTTTAMEGKVYDKRGAPRLNRYYEKFKPYYKLDPENHADKTLVFESRFECGNLKRAVKVGEYEYDLYLKNDYGTGGFTQWYFFKVSNTRKDRTYRFNIVNLMKPDSTYNIGMKPLLYSVKEADQTGIGWYRDGYNIAYYQNSRKSKNQRQILFLIIKQGQAPNPAA